MPKSPAVEVVSPEARVVTKIGLCTPFQIVGGDVFTFIDAAKHKAVMTMVPEGVSVVLAPKFNGSEKNFLVPWANLTYVQHVSAVG